MNLGQVLKDWRYINRLSQQAAGDTIGIPAGVLKQLEEGKDVKGSNLATVLTWLTSEDIRHEHDGSQVRLQLEDRRAAG